MQLIFVTVKTAFAEETTNALAKVIETYPGLELFDFRAREDKNYTLIKFAGEVDVVLKFVNEMIFRKLAHTRKQNQDPSLMTSDILTDITFSPISGVSLFELENILKGITKDIEKNITRPVFFVGLKDNHHKPGDGIKKAKPSNGNLPDSSSNEVKIRIQKFHVNISFILGTDNLETVQNISDRIGSQGPVLFNRQGKLVKNSSGKVLRGDGIFKTVDTMVLPNNIGKSTQLVFKIKDYENPTLVQLWDQLQEICFEEIVENQGTTLLGCIPLAVISACFKNLPVLEKRKYNSVQEYLPRFIELLGLNKFGEFVPEYQIIDYHFPA